MSRHFVASVGSHGSDASIINRQPDQRFYSLTWTQFLRLAELLELSEWDPVYSETRLLLRHRNNVEVDFSLKQESPPTTTQNPSPMAHTNNPELQNSPIRTHTLAHSVTIHRYQTRYQPDKSQKR